MSSKGDAPQGAFSLGSKTSRVPSGASDPALLYRLADELRLCALECALYALRGRDTTSVRRARRVVDELDAAFVASYEWYSEVLLRYGWRPVTVAAMTETTEQPEPDEPQPPPEPPKPDDE